MNQTVIDIKPFCATLNDAPSTFNLDAPWIEGGYRYATNGCIMVRVPCDEPDTDRSTRRLVKNPGKALLRSAGAIWEPWPAIEPCPVCPGDGMVPLRCVQCKGNRQEEMCESCCGQGAYMGPCPDCSGKVKIGAAIVSKWFARLIAALPNCEMILPAEWDKAVQFRFAGGGEGAVMPIDPGVEARGKK